VRIGPAHRHAVHRQQEPPAPSLPARAPRCRGRRAGPRSRSRHRRATAPSARIPAAPPPPTKSNRLPTLSAVRACLRVDRRAGIPCRCAVRFLFLTRNAGHDRSSILADGGLIMGGLSPITLPDRNTIREIIRASQGQAATAGFGGAGGSGCIVAASCRCVPTPASGTESRSGSAGISAATRIAVGTARTAWSGYRIAWSRGLRRLCPDPTLPRALGRASPTKHGVSRSPPRRRGDEA
jgi:hypothetical protein